MFDDNSVRALILSFIAGMSTLIGTLVVFIVKQRSEKLVSASLGFAGGVMISVSLIYCPTLMSFCKVIQEKK